MLKTLAMFIAFGLAAPGVVEGAAAPEAVDPSAGAPETVEPEAVEPETVEPEIVEPEAVEPEAVEPEAVEPEAVEPEAVEDPATPEAKAPVFPEEPDEGEDHEEGSIATIEFGKKDKKDKKDKISVELRARVVAGAYLDAKEPAIGSDGVAIGQPVRRGVLELRQARFGVDLNYRDILRVRLKADFADFLDSPEADNVLRDAWANIKIHRAFQIKVGNFKRPYSRLELRGFSSVPIVGRGLYNSRAIEDLAWGDRAVGVSLWGKIKPKRPGLHALRWAVSVTNDAVSGAPHGVDVHARLTYDPIKWMSIAVGGAYKRVEDPLADEATCRSTWARDDECRRDVFGASGDLTFRVKGLYASAEANLAQDWQFTDTSPWMLGVLGYVSYDFELGKRTRLQPVVFAEFVDTNLSFSESEAIRAAVGLNVMWTKHLRLMPQVQFVQPLAPVTAFNFYVQRRIYGLWLSVRL